MTAVTTTSVITVRAAASPRANAWRKRWSAAWPALALSALILIAWEALVHIFNVSEFVLAAPSAIFASLIESAPLLWDATIVTFQEIVYGFALSIVVGSVLALVIVRFSFIERAVYPLVVLFQVVPKVALAPIFILWFGYGLTPKLWLIVVIAFFPITLNMIVGLKAYDPDLHTLMKSVGAGRSAFLWRVQLPTSLPYFLAGLRIAITLCVIGAVVAEFSGASAGLGYLIQFASTQLDTPLMFAALAVISLLGLILYYAIYLVELLIALAFPHVRTQRVE